MPKLQLRAGGLWWVQGSILLCPHNSSASFNKSPTVPAPPQEIATLRLFAHIHIFLQTPHFFQMSVFRKLQHDFGTSHSNALCCRHRRIRVWRKSWPAHQNHFMRQANMFYIDFIYYRLAGFTLIEILSHWTGTVPHDFCYLLDDIQT